MKIRWNQNSLRLRITPGELEKLLRGEPSIETLRLPGGLVWAVQLGAGDATSLTSGGTAALLSLSLDDRQQLAAPDTEGVYFRTEEGLRFFVEKDFPCAHPRAAEALEPPTETFEAPAGFEDRKGMD